MFISVFGTVFVTVLAAAQVRSDSARSASQCPPESPPQTALGWSLGQPGVVEGVVVAVHSGDVLSQISVSLMPDSIVLPLDSEALMDSRYNGIRYTVTDSGGRFRLDNVAPGSYGVRVQQGGWLAAKATVAIGRDGLKGVAALVVAFPRPAERLIQKIVPFPRLADRLVGMIEGVVHGLSVVKSPARVVAVIAWSLVIWLVNVSSFYVGFKAFDIPLNFAGAMLLQGILAFAITVPTAPGFVGVFEGAIKATLLLYGISDSVAVTYALVYHATTFVPITLLGAWSLMSTGLGLRNLQRASIPEKPVPG